jgi:hypothetical protein
MAKLFKWFFVLLALLGLLGVAAAVSLHYWLGSGDFRSRLEAESSEFLGVPVALSRVHLSFWPQPAIALDGVQVRTTPALSMVRVELRPEWRALLAGRREVAALVVREAQWPQRGIDQLLAARQKTRVAPPKDVAPASTDEGDSEPDLSVDWVLRHVVLQQVTWRNARDVATTFDADARLADDSLPQTLDLQVREGPWKDAKLDLVRDGARWAVEAQLGGGTVRGHLQYAALAPAVRVRTLTGELVTRGVEVTALAASASGQRGPLSGQLEATTTVSARAPTAAGLLPALQTQSRFTVHNAELHGLDLAKAVTTVGLSRGGETRLDTLTGQLDTQGRGTARLHELVASSGVLRATGEVALAPSRALSGRVLVDLTAGAAGRLVGVPLTVSGTLDAPEVTLSRGAMLGAAIGTAVMPGVGTGAGAQMGDRLSQGVKKLFEK